MHGEQADDVMWPIINGHTDFFRDLPPCQGALEFFKDVRHLNPTILTACPKVNYPHVAALKREWVQRHLGHDVTVLPVMGGRHKPLFMHAKGDILIDDHRRNTGAWEAAGGHAILHRHWAITRGALGAMLAREPVAWVQLCRNDSQIYWQTSKPTDQMPIGRYYATRSP
jgi:5'-nucleotidase